MFDITKSPSNNEYMLFSKKLIWIAVFVLILASGFWGVKAGWKFIKERPAKKYYGEETLVQRGFVPLGQWGRRETKHREKSSGDIVISEGTKIITDTEFLHAGSITLLGESRLAFQNSVVEMTPQDARRADIFVKDKAELIFENSTLKPHADDPANIYVYVQDDAKFVFNNSDGLHMLIAGDNSRVQIYNSTWAYSAPNFRGGGVQLSQAAQADIKNSTIGGIILDLPQEARANINGFKVGKFASLDLHKDFSMENTGLNIVLLDTEILGDYLEGGSERGLSIFAPSNIQQLTIANSELNKLVIQSADEDFEFRDLAIDEPADFSFRNISVKNSKIMAQWGFFMHGGSGAFTDSKGLWFFLYDDAKLMLNNSEMNEFDPRNFTGTIEFIDSIWKNAGEIIENNNFNWNGSWLAEGFEENTFRPLIWDKSAVAREFPVDIFLLNPGPAPARGAVVNMFNKDNKHLGSYTTDNSGRAYFTVKFDGNNYRDVFYVKASKFGKEARHEINFLTPTPIKLILK